ncbi:MAG: RNA polymerase sigma factor [Bryobacteraceae bacterium]
MLERAGLDSTQDDRQDDPLRASFLQLKERSRAELHREVERAFEDGREDVYHHLLALGVPAPQAQELTQEAFLRLYVSLRGGEPIQSARAWVFRVAHNLGLKERAKAARLHPIDPELESTLTRGDTSPEQDLLAGERNRRLHKAIGELSPQQRQCLHLRAEGLRYREIASTIGISASSVGEFLSRALSKLRKAVHE